MNDPNQIAKVLWPRRSICCTHYSGFIVDIVDGLNDKDGEGDDDCGGEGDEGGVSLILNGTGDQEAGRGPIKR